MKARKGDVFWGIPYAIGVLIMAAAAFFYIMPAEKRDLKKNIIETGCFEYGQKIYKVTEYSKLEYPEKGTEK